jgi:hypothetical protein
MDIAIFSGSFCLATFVGLTMKKHGVFIIPQSFDIFGTNRQYFDKIEQEMGQAEVEHYFTLPNTTRHM